MPIAGSRRARGNDHLAFAVEDLCSRMKVQKQTERRALFGFSNALISDQFLNNLKEGGIGKRTHTD